MNSRYGWLASTGTALSLVACYGTLAVVAVPGALGIAMALNEALWAGTIVLFAAFAVGGLGLGLRQHRIIWPVVIGGIGAVTLVYTVYVQYDRLIEFVGFTLLCVSVYSVRRIRRAIGG